MDSDGSNNGGGKDGYAQVEDGGRLSSLGIFIISYQAVNLSVRGRA